MKENQMMLESKRRALNKYNAKCDRIEFRPLADEGQRIREAAAAAGESLQGYILKAIRERMERESK